jgi:hypothetical protein
MKRNLKILKKLVLKNLNTIEKTAKNITSNWGKKTIPLNLLKEIIYLSKPTGNSDELKDFVIKYNKMLNTLYSTCESAAKRMNTKEVPIDLLQKYIDVLKTEFVKSLNE